MHMEDTWEKPVASVDDNEATRTGGDDGWRKQMYAKLGTISAAQRVTAQRLDWHYEQIHSMLVSLHVEVVKVKGRQQDVGARARAESNLSAATCPASLLTDAPAPTRSTRAGSPSPILHVSGQPHLVLKDDYAEDIILQPEPTQSLLGEPTTRGSSSSAETERQPGKKKTADQVCSCGNVCMNDAKFCRSCGVPRPLRPAMNQGADNNTEGFVAPSLPLFWPMAIPMRVGFVDNEQDTLGAGSPPGSPLGAARRNTRICSPPSFGELLEKQKKMWEEMRTYGPPWYKRFVLDPNNPMILTTIFTNLSMVVLLYDIITIPYVLAWEVDMSRHGFLRAVMIINACYWTWDCTLSFITGYYIEGEVELAPGKICDHYLRTWFAPDFLMCSCDWTGIILEEVGGTNLVKFGTLRRLIRILAMMRLLRVVRLPRMLETVSYESRSDGFRCAIMVMGAIVGVLLVVHYIVCSYTSLGRYGPTDTGYSWTDVTITTGSEAHPYLELSEMHQYVIIFHWIMSMFTVGNEVVYAYNSGERIFNIFGLLISMLTTCTLISTISSVMVNFQLAKAEESMNTQLLNKFLRESGVRKSIAVLVRRQVAQRQKKAVEAQSDKDVPTLALLSPKLLSELRFDLCVKHLECHPLFSVWISIDEHLAKQLCVDALDFLTLRQDDELFKAGNPCDRAYLITSGAVEYIQDPDFFPVYAEINTEVPVGQWLCEAALWSHWIHVGTAQVKVGPEVPQTCRVLTCRPEGMLKVMARNRPLRHVTQQYCQVFHSRMALCGQDGVPWPTDLQVPVTTTQELMRSMKWEARLIVTNVTLEKLERELTQFGFVGSRVSRRTLTESQINNLREEVFSGMSTLIPNEFGEVERLQNIAVLRITDSEGRIFVQLGGEDPLLRIRQPSICLPSIRVEMDEDPDHAVKRLITTKLPMLKGVLETLRKDLDCQVDLQESKEFGVPTKSIKFVYHARVSEPILVPTCSISDDQVGVIRRLPAHSVQRHASMNSRVSPLFGRSGSSSSIGMQPSMNSEGCRPGRVHPLPGRSGSGRLFSSSSIEMQPQTSEPVTGGFQVMQDHVFICSTEDTNDAYVWSSPEQLEYLSEKDGKAQVTRWLSVLDIEGAIQRFNVSRQLEEEEEKQEDLFSVQEEEEEAGAAWEGPGGIGEEQALRQTVAELYASRGPPPPPLRQNVPQLLASRGPRPPPLLPVSNRRTHSA